jgi:hypothetical protein
MAAFLCGPLRKPLRPLRLSLVKEEGNERKERKGFRKGRKEK